MRFHTISVLSAFLPAAFAQGKCSGLELVYGTVVVMQKHWL